MEVNVLKYSQRYIIILVAQLLILGLLIIEYGAGEDSYILLHDHLDGLPVVKCLEHQEVSYWDPTSVVPQPLGGTLTVASIFNRVEFGILFYHYFGVFPGIVINAAIARFVAFWGMYLLLSAHILKNGSRLVIIGAALCFACLPFTPGGLTVAGQPLLVYAFWNLWKNKNKTLSWLVICLMPFYSSLVLAGFAVITLVFGGYVFGVIKSKQLHLQVIAAILAHSLLCLASNYKLIYNMLFREGYVSHRSVSSIGSYININFEQALKTATENFLFGQYHAASLQTKFIGLSVAIAIVLLVLKRRWSTPFAGLILGAFSISVFYGFWYLIQNNLPDFMILKDFNWGRFHFLHPLLWGVLFAVSLQVIKDNLPSRRVVGSAVVFVLLLGQVTYAYHRNINLAEEKKTGLTFKQYYSEELFEKIAKKIGKEKSSYRVVSVGIHPSVALYSGFYTLDYYATDYSLDYKNKFRKIIADELKKNEDMRKYYDDWGNRVYIFANDLWKIGNLWTFPIPPKKGYLIKDLDIDASAFKRLGGRYVFSAYFIKNSVDSGMHFVGMFTEKTSPYSIYVYEVM